MSRALPVLFLAAFLAGCTAIGPRPVLRSPEDNVDAMRRAWREDDPGLFIHCLSTPVLKRVGESAVRIGWSEVRPSIGRLVERARVVEVADTRTQAPDVLVSPEFIWPEADRPAKRLRLEVDGVREDFLFVREIDPAPEQSSEAEGFWVGDRYFVRREHPSPRTYLTEESKEADRTHWRLVFPYYPYNREGRLARLLQDELKR